MDTNREKTMEAAISPTVAGSLALMRGHTPVWLLVGGNLLADLCYCLADPRIKAMRGDKR